jgi:uncharacterized protein YcaQ
LSQTLSLAEARRIALAAQLFVPAVGAPKGAAALGKIVHRLGAVQIDSVNVLVRSHYLPIFSRCGPYAPDLLERAAYDGNRSLFEYWGHEASFLPVDFYPLFRWRMERARNGEGTWKRLRRYATSHQQLVTSALEQIRERGALGASELADCGKAKGSWWGWSQGKEVLEWLFWIGEVTTARRRNFERLYDLTERVLPERVRTASVPSPQQARRELMAISARALGVATARDLRDYFRLPAEDAATRIAELVEQGTLQPVTVEGWKQQAYLHADAVCPRRAGVSALLSPFDSLIWERQRTQRLFGFYFRLEIYTPIHKRLHGYYVLPFLLGDRLVGRVDLKANRHEGRLEVRGGSVEEGVRVGGVVEPLAAELRKLAQWLRLEGVSVTSRRGELMRELKTLVNRRAPSATANRKGRQPRTA